MRLRLAVFLVVVFGAAAVGLAADPVISENPVPPNSFAEVKIALDPGDKVSWAFTRRRRRRASSTTARPRRCASTARRGPSTPSFTPS